MRDREQASAGLEKKMADQRRQQNLIAKQSERQIQEMYRDENGDKTWKPEE